MVLKYTLLAIFAFCVGRNALHIKNEKEKTQNRKKQEEEGSKHIERGEKENPVSE